MDLIPVKAVTDDDGHWYVIPHNKYSEFKKLMNRNYDEDQEVPDEFENKFWQYRTGGDLNNIQLYANIK